MHKIPSAYTDYADFGIDLCIFSKAITINANKNDIKQVLLKGLESKKEISATFASRYDLSSRASSDLYIKYNTDIDLDEDEELVGLVRPSDEDKIAKLEELEPIISKERVDEILNSLDIYADSARKILEDIQKLDLSPMEFTGSVTDYEYKFYSYKQIEEDSQESDDISDASEDTDGDGTLEDVMESDDVTEEEAEDSDNENEDFDNEDEVGDSDNEDLSEGEDISFGDQDESSEDDDDSIEDLSESTEDDEEVEDITGSDTETGMLEKTVSVPYEEAKDVSVDLGDDEDISDMFVSQRREVTVPKFDSVVSAPVLHAVVDTIDKDSEPREIRAFLRKHPKADITEVLKYFTKDQVRDAIKLGKVVKKGDKLKL